MESNFRVTTAAVNKLYERATAAAMRKTIASYSVKLGIFEKQIYKYITDKASNVLKTGELMRSDFALTENFVGQNDEDIKFGIQFQISVLKT